MATRTPTAGSSSRTVASCTRTPTRSGEARTPEELARFPDNPVDAATVGAIFTHCGLPDRLD